MTRRPSPVFPRIPPSVVRAPADRPLSALLAIVALVATWALLLYLVQVVSGGAQDRLAAQADPVADEPPAVEARP